MRDRNKSLIIFCIMILIALTVIYLLYGKGVAIEKIYPIYPSNIYVK